MTTPVDLILLPWVRRGGSTALTQPDTNGADQPGIASATVTLEVNGAVPVPMAVALMGPGHVTAVSAGQVIRTDPTPGSVVFEPNYLALVEFDEPSLPWLFTPAGAATSGRLRPWLCLVVVRKQNGVSLDPPDRGAVPVLRIGAPAVPAEELPDPADAWAWAHAQVTAESGASPSALIASLDSQPERSLSRLLCGRVLQPDTAYLACVVPTFELGRKAGLGLDITATDEARLDPAWTNTPGVELPVYSSWEFTTGSGGDFQSLALLLRARPLPDGVGQREIDISHSGVDLAVPDPTRLNLGGALRPVGQPPPAWPDETLHGAYRTALARLLNVATDADPVLAPPRYGAMGGNAPVDAGGQTWFEQLNLEPPMRVAAQFGTVVVQQQQEALVASAWQQAADSRAVNQTLRHAQLGCAVATSLHRRHLANLAPDAGLQVLAPAQARLTRTPAARVPGTGLAALITDTRLTTSAFSTALRRIARPQGAVNRRVQRAAVIPGMPRTSFVLSNLQPTVVIGRHIVMPTGPASVERVAAALVPPREDITWAAATATRVLETAGRAIFEVLPPPAGAPPVLLPPPPDGPPDQPPPVSPPTNPGPFPVDTPDAAAFRAAAAAHLRRFDPAPPIIFVPPAAMGVDVVFAAAIAAAEPRQHYATAISALVDFKTADRTGDDPSTTATVTPTYPQPMALSLAELGQELMLPGLDGVPANTIVPLETNTAFVEAFLLGLNSEFGRELLWRQYPAPQRTTYFDRFWDAGIDPDAPPDIPPLADWNDRPLGGAASTGTERFVMLVRSDLLRRYPHAVIYATKPDDVNHVVLESHPIFSGAMDPDVRFFGFDIPADEIGEWSIVIQEQPSAPRFGVEVGADTGGGPHLSVTADQNSARVAVRLRQTPVRITIPSTVLLRDV